MADLTDLQAAQTVKVVGSDLTGLETNAMNVDSSGNAYTTVKEIVPVVIDSALNNIPTDANMDTYSSYSPDPRNVLVGTGKPALDASDRIEVHATTTSDEGSFREDFPGSSLLTTLTGTLTFTNGSTTVTGNGTAFTTELKQLQYLKKTADSETNFAQISSITNDTTLELATPYAGTTATTTGVWSNWKTTTTGTLTVANSVLAFLCPTANAATQVIQRAGDYGPYSIGFKASFSQRIANQIIRIGGFDNPSNISYGAWFEISGTTNTTVICSSRSSSGASDLQTTTVTIPSGINSAALNRFEISISNNGVSFVINGILVASHADHIPDPYGNINLACVSTNSAAVTATTVNLDWFLFYNLDQTEIANSFSGEPLPTVLRYNFKNIAGAATTVVKSGPGLLHTLTINVAAAVSVTIYDNTAASGTIIQTLSVPNNSLPFTLTYDVQFSNGLTIVTTGGGTNVTASYL